MVWSGSLNEFVYINGVFICSWFDFGNLSIPKVFGSQGTQGFDSLGNGSKRCYPLGPQVLVFVFLLPAHRVF